MESEDINDTLIINALRDSGPELRIFLKELTFIQSLNEGCNDHPTIIGEIDSLIDEEEDISDIYLSKKDNVELYIKLIEAYINLLGDYRNLLHILSDKYLDPIKYLSNNEFKGDSLIGNEIRNWFIAGCKNNIIQYLKKGRMNLRPRGVDLPISDAYITLKLGDKPEKFVGFDDATNENLVQCYLDSSDIPLIHEDFEELKEELMRELNA